MEHHAFQKLHEPFSLLSGDRSRMACRGPEGRLIRREPIAFQLDGIALGIGTKQQEVAEIRDEDLSIRLPVFRDLRAIRG